MVRDTKTNEWNASGEAFTLCLADWKTLIYDDHLKASESIFFPWEKVEQIAKDAFDQRLAETQHKNFKDLPEVNQQLFSPFLPILTLSYLYKPNNRTKLGRDIGT
jgi:hypothetical protein